ncbi:hypothetical protein ACIPPS_25035 [Streptomyces sp. NPDC090127]|uniref:hypothetical protein n=1 Tax=Streptomyces sp. NPDC090127 TaxID=3365953 RepID=UPI00381EAC1F
MTALAVRPLLSVAAASLALGTVSLAGAPAAYAAPGDNGDVKVHHAGPFPPRTPVDDRSNKPQVCKFYFSAFDFDGLQELNWTVSPQPAVDSVALTGRITVDAQGNGNTPNLALADGMYKVEWTWEGQQGAAKSKVFRVDCLDDVTNPTQPPTTGGNGGNGPQRPPHGPVGAGGGGSADALGGDSAFGVGAALAAGLAGMAGLILVRRSRRRTHGAS